MIQNLIVELCLIMMQLQGQVNKELFLNFKNYYWNLQKELKKICIKYLTYLINKMVMKIWIINNVVRM